MIESHLLILAGFFVASLIFSLLINRFLLKFSKTLGIRDTSQTIIRWSSTSKPSLGGISFFIIFLLSLVMISFVQAHDFSFFNLSSLGIVIATTIGFLLGLCDDAYNTSPLLKLGAQILCGLILISTGTYINVFDAAWVNYALTMLWVVGMMNSINMLDNMDGIIAVVSISILGAILFTMLLMSHLGNPLIIIVVGIMASLIGFLFYNWHPSKMYMGDTGSQLLGVLLAALGVIFYWNGLGFAGESTPFVRFISVAIIFALPLIDTITVTIKRIAKGGSPFVGGKDHTTHHISYLGLNDRQVGIVFVLLSLVSMVITIVITNYIDQWKQAHTIGFGLYFIVLFAVLFFIANLNKSRN